MFFNCFWFYLLLFTTNYLYFFMNKKIIYLQQNPTLNIFHSSLSFGIRYKFYWISLEKMKDILAGESKCCVSPNLVMTRRRPSFSLVYIFPSHCCANKPWRTMSWKRRFVEEPSFLAYLYKPMKIKIIVSKIIKIMKYILYAFSRSLKKGFDGLVCYSWNVRFVRPKWCDWISTQLSNISINWWKALFFYT